MKDTQLAWLAAANERHRIALEFTRLAASPAGIADNAAAIAILKKVRSLFENVPEFPGTQS
jgi:hypothetical protein